MHPASIVVLALAVATATGRLLMWIGGVNEHKSEVSEFMREIRADIKRIFQRLPSKTPDRGSPVRLTALGAEVAKQIGARRWAVNQAGALRERVQGRAPYRIQDFAFEYVRYEYRPAGQFEAQLEAVAYQDGVTNEEVHDVLAIALRDELAGPGADTSATPQRVTAQ